MQNPSPGAPGFQHPYPPNNFYGGPPPPGSWGRGGGPGPMAGPAFGNMPYPPPPGWFTPGQGFPPGGPGGPGHWGNAPFPPGPGGPHGPDSSQGHPAAPSATATGTQDGKPPPIGPGLERPKVATPSQPAPPTEPKSLAQAALQRSNAPTPPVESKPSVEEVKAAAATVSANGPSKHSANAPKAVPTAPKNNRVTPVVPLVGLHVKPFQPPFAEQKAAKAAPDATPSGPSSVQDATNAARAAVAVAMAQLSNGGGNAMDNLTNKVNEMRVNAARVSNPSNRGRGRGGRPVKVEVPESDFDFAQANAKFNKEDIVKEAIAGSPLTETSNGPPLVPSETPDLDVPVVAYNKSRSFFDNISSESRERSENNGQKPGGREWRGEEQRKNMETFGQGSVDGGYRNYRGRGRGRGNRGRGGFGRGGRGGPRPPYEGAAPGQ